MFTAKVVKKSEEVRGPKTRGAFQFFASTIDLLAESHGKGFVRMGGLGVLPVEFFLLSLRRVHSLHTKAIGETRLASLYAKIIVEANI